MKTKVDKLDVNKLVHVLFDFSKLSDVVKNTLIRKDVYNAKIINIENEITDITNLASNTTVNVKINEVKGETPSITNAVTIAAFNAIINYFKGKILSITNLDTNATFIAVKNKIPNVSSLVKKTDYDTKNLKN